jgi:inosose dehydratase
VLKNLISCHLITWGEDFDSGLREAQSLGYRAVETFTHLAMRYEDRVEEFKELLDSHGFRLSALYAGGRFSDPTNRQTVIEDNAKVASFLAANGVDRIVFGPGGPRNPEGTSVEELTTAAETIDQAARRCYELGVKACVHPHLGTEIQDRAEIEAIMEMTDPRYVLLAPDTAHLAGAGIDVPDFLRTYRDRIGYMHVKDLTPEKPDLASFPMMSGTEALPIFCELGLGTIDFDPIVEAIMEIGYGGWLTLEIDQSTSTPINSLRICRDFVEQRLGISIARTDDMPSAKVGVGVIGCGSISGTYLHVLHDARVPRRGPVRRPCPSQQHLRSPQANADPSAGGEA